MSFGIMIEMIVEKYLGFMTQPQKWNEFCRMQIKTIVVVVSTILIHKIHS